MPPRRASRFSVSPQRSARASTAGSAPTSSSGTRAAGGTLSSDRTERISDTRSISQPISALAAASSFPAAGQDANASRVVRAGPRSPVAAQSSSVMKGMNGCRSFRISSSTKPVTAWVSVLAAPSGPVSTGFASSRCQSQNTFHTNR